MVETVLLDCTATARTSALLLCHLERLVPLNILLLVLKADTTISTASVLLPSATFTLWVEPLLQETVPLLNPSLLEVLAALLSFALLDLPATLPTSNVKPQPLEETAVIQFLAPTLLTTANALLTPLVPV